jgi:hypothetical protein
MKEESIVQERWIAFLLWVVVLAAVIYTSRYVVEQSIVGDLGTVLRTSAIFNNINDRERIEVSTLARLVLILVLVSQMLWAWIKFVFLTDEFVAVFVKSEISEQKVSLFSAFLGFGTDSAEETENNDEAEAAYLDSAPSNIGGILRPLGYLWVTLLLSPITIEIIAKLFDSEY